MCSVTGGIPWGRIAPFCHGLVSRHGRPSVFPTEDSSRSLFDSEGLPDGVVPALHLLVTPSRDQANLLRRSVDGGANTAKVGDQADSVCFVDAPWRGNKVDHLLRVAARLVGANTGGRSILEDLELLEVAARFICTPTQHDGDVVDNGCLGQFAQWLLVVLNVDHCQQDAQRILALEVSDAVVDVLWVQAVVFEREEEGTCGCADDIVGGDV